MSYYNLTRETRIALTGVMKEKILAELYKDVYPDTICFFSDNDTYIRKNAYLLTGRLYFENQGLQAIIIYRLKVLLNSTDYKVRQTVINAAGEIGKKQFTTVQFFFDTGLTDMHHSPRNAVIGAIKKMGEVNPEPVLKWARNYLHHPDKEIRREICHGIELRGRTDPADILPLLKELEHDPTLRVKNTLVHVLGQISYKKNCLPIVVAQLNTWQNKELVSKAAVEIVAVHHRYQQFAHLTAAAAQEYLNNHLQSGNF